MTAFSDIETVLNGVSILQDIPNKLRRHSLEMAVNTLSRRSVQCDFNEVKQAADAISDAARRLEACVAMPNGGVV